MTKDEEIEELKMHQRVLIAELVKARGQLRKVVDTMWNIGDPELEALRDETKEVYEDLRDA